jgi:predicted HAD superfamily Cof-like phosphohydrolase
MSAEEKAATGGDFYQEIADKLGISRSEAKRQHMYRLYGGGAKIVEMTPLQKVAHFHDKFGLPGVEQGAPRELTDEEALFRINFMLEEQAEYAECSGFNQVAIAIRLVISHLMTAGSVMRLRDDERDFHGQLDALVDLSYVLHGTALFHGFNRFDQAFDTVHAANMAKERATRPEQSKRGTTFDVIKPKGWTPPVLTEFLS